MSEPLKHHRLFFLAMCVAGFLSAMDLTAMGVLIGPMKQFFGVSVTTAQWFMTAYALGASSFYIVSGKLCDIFGKRRMFVLGLSVFAFMSLLIAFMPTVHVVIAARFVQGLSCSLMIGGSFALVMEHVAPNIRHKAMGTLAFAAGLGFVLAPTLGGFLLHTFGWQSVFLLNVPVILITLCIIFYAVPKGNRFEQKLDWVGALLLMATLIVLSLLISHGYEWGIKSFAVKQAVVVLVILLVALVWWEKKQRSPVIKSAVLGYKGFVGAGVAGALMYAVWFGWVLVFGFYLKDTQGLNGLQVGLVFLPLSIGVVVASKTIPKLTDVISQKILLALMFILFVVCAAWVMCLGDKLTVYSLMAPFFLYGFGLNGVNVLSLPMALKHAPADSHGSASGHALMLRWLGGALGAAVLAVIFSQGLAVSPLHALQLCVWTVFGVSLVGVVWVVCLV